MLHVHLRHIYVYVVVYYYFYILEKHPLISWCARIAFGFLHHEFFTISHHVSSIQNLCHMVVNVIPLVKQHNSPL